MYPAGNSRSSYEIGDKFNKPIVLDGPAAATPTSPATPWPRKRGVRSGDDMVAKLSRSCREGVRLTKVLIRRMASRRSRAAASGLRGLPEASWRVGSKHPYREMSDEMNRLLGSWRRGSKPEAAAELIRKADKSFIDENYVLRSMIFDRSIRNLMARHGCNAFTIDCFEFCPQAAAAMVDYALPAPCDVRQRGLRRRARPISGRSAVPVDERMNKSPHQGNGDLRSGDTFRNNHSAPSMK